MERCVKCKSRWVTHSAGNVCLTCQKEERFTSPAQRVVCPFCKGLRRGLFYQGVEKEYDCPRCWGRGTLDVHSEPPALPVREMSVDELTEANKRNPLPALESDKTNFSGNGGECLDER